MNKVLLEHSLLVYWHIVYRPFLIMCRVVAMQSLWFTKSNYSLSGIKTLLTTAREHVLLFNGTWMLGWDYAYWLVHSLTWLFFSSTERKLELFKKWKLHKDDAKDQASRAFSWLVKGSRKGWAHCRLWHPWKDCISKQAEQALERKLVGSTHL